MNISRAAPSTFLVLGLLAGTASAVNIETVPVGNPGNAGELSGEGAGGSGPDRICGAVGYTYNIGKYEVTAGSTVSSCTRWQRQTPTACSRRPATAGQDRGC